MSERKIVNRVKKLKELEEQKAQLEKQIYDGTVLLADTGGKYVNYRVEHRN